MDRLKQFGYVLNLTKFAFKANPLLYLSILISLFSVAVELLAMTSLLPLFEIISGGQASDNGFIARSLALLGVSVNGSAFFGTFVVLLTIRVITQLCAQSLSFYLGRRVMAQLASQAFEQIMRSVSVSEISKKSIGYFISLAGDESFKASVLIISLTQLVGIVCLASLYFIAIINYSFATGIFVLFFLFFSFVALGGIFRASHKLGGRQVDESRRAASIFLDSLNNLKAVRSFSSESYVVKLYRTLMYKYTKTLFLVDAMALLSKLLPVLLLLIIVGIWFAVRVGKIEEIGLVFIVTMSAYLMRFFPVIGQGLGLLMKMISDAKTGRDVTRIIGADWGEAGINSISLKGTKKIELRNLGFSYDDDGKKQILTDVNYQFESGNSYAISGKSGIGKSTLIDLLLKFYKPSSGNVYFDGISIDEISTAAVRGHVILVSQDAAIFDDTVMNNICMGVDASLMEVQVACRKALIHDDIELMENGYETRLHYQGKNLSGGQRQRVAIARALLRKPEVLILDESTSALDKATQNKVIENILEELNGKIVIFVTHDPYIIKRTHAIVDLAEINFAVRKNNSENELA